MSRRAIFMGYDHHGRNRRDLRKGGEMEMFNS
jgi:hypothetical protein